VDLFSVIDCIGLWDLVRVWPTENYFFCLAQVNHLLFTAHFLIFSNSVVIKISFFSGTSRKLKFIGLVQDSCLNKTHRGQREIIKKSIYLLISNR
jgi:hypothetical protein